MFELRESSCYMYVCETEAEKGTATPSFSVSVNKLKKGLATDKILFEIKFPGKHSIIRKLTTALNAIRKEKVCSVPQERISGFFK